MAQEIIHSEQKFLILLAEIVEDQIWLQGVLHESVTRQVVINDNGNSLMAIRSPVVDFESSSIAESDRPAYLSFKVSDNQATLPLLRPDENLQENADLEETTLILSGISPGQSSKELK